MTYKSGESNVLSRVSRTTAHLRPKYAETRDTVGSSIDTLADV